MQEDIILVVLDDVLEEIKDALEYGRSLGYAECLNQTIGNKPESSLSDQAMEHYIKSRKESYESEED